jgi:hypothetical protein
LFGFGGEHAAADLGEGGFRSGHGFSWTVKVYG